MDTMLSPKRRIWESASRGTELAHRVAESAKWRSRTSELGGRAGVAASARRIGGDVVTDHESLGSCRTFRDFRNRVHHFPGGLGVESDTRVKRNHDSPLTSLVDSVTAFRTEKNESGTQQLGLRFRGGQTGGLRHEPRLRL